MPCIYGIFIDVILTKMNEQGVTCLGYWDGGGYLKFSSLTETPLFAFPKNITSTLCLFLHLFTKVSSHLYANTSYCLYALLIYLKFPSLSATPLFMFPKKSLVLFVCFSIYLRRIQVIFMLILVTVYMLFLFI